MIKRRLRVSELVLCHLSETCDEGLSRFIAEVQTAAGPVTDGDVTAPLHRALRGKGLLPTHRIVDTDYLSAGLLARGRRVTSG